MRDVLLLLLLLLTIFIITYFPKIIKFILLFPSLISIPLRPKKWLSFIILFNINRLQQTLPIRFICHIKDVFFIYIGMMLRLLSATTSSGCQNSWFGFWMIILLLEMSECINTTTSMPATTTLLLQTITISWSYMFIVLRLCLLNWI